MSIPQVKLIIEEIHQSVWLEDLHAKPKLRTYSLFKYKAGPEAYLTNYLPRQQRSLLTQICLGILPLSIETGRFQNKKVEQRLCPLCSKCVETELHFICICEKFKKRIF